MKLLNEIVKSENTYLDRLAQIEEQVSIWMKQIATEKRLGLKPIDLMIAESDPYNTADRTNTRPDDTVEFTPTSEPIEKPTNIQASSGTFSATRIHLIYNPATGEIEKTLKTPIRSRPPADYMEANADQVAGALRHLEKMNPKLADLLVSGRMSVWIPRAAAKAGPTSVKHLGLNTNPNIESRGNSNVAKMSPEDLERAQAAASKMKIA
ncbi:MAG: hypothetical protein KGI25_09070 [Thaumarchaeota archaeon]|nr:hypothetical protein [Nitrososphaerota archaeon]